jgi:TatD DNase family protein
MKRSFPVFMIVDIHCHLEHAWFDKDRDDVVKRAKEAGVKAILTAGINHETNRQALDLAEKYDIVRAALGIYPVDALKKEVDSCEFPVENRVLDVDEEMAFIRENRDRVAAVGEIGLDFVDSDEDERKEQRQLFRKMLDLARELEKPVIVHTRKAEAEAVEMLEDYKDLKVILHCFMGKKRLVKQAYDLGFYFSIPCNIVRAQNFQMIVGMVSITKLFTETDGPYLSPFRGERNEPANIREAIRKIAEIKGMEEEEVEKNLFMNYQRVF